MSHAPAKSMLPPQYDPSEVEARLYAEAERAGRFAADPSQPGEPFSIVIPPPNVTGVLHIGHALNGTVQDILTRRRRMQGRNTLWLPGMDHAGIATQNVVERKLRAEGIDPRALGREAFLEKVWEWKEHHGARIYDQFKALGCSCDWTRARFTMDEGLSRAVRTVFKRLFDEGLIYRDTYLINWSTKLQTALSDDEVERREVKGSLWHLRYPLADGSGHAIVATTRPETMLGDTAVAVNPNDQRYKKRIGKTVRLPLMDREIPIIADEAVVSDFGSGMVKVTPAHDPTDYDMGKRHGLQFINLLHPDGRLNENAGAYAGLSTEEGRKRVVADLEARGLIEKIEPYTHSVGFCYRSGCVVEPYISKQWFVKMRPLAEPAIAAARDGRIRFVPAEWDKTYYRWMENVRDWCISRQLWWGHRIPVFTCERCGHAVCEIDEAPAKCARCDGGPMVQDPDVLDTWFSSALWPFSTMGWPEATDDLKRYYPTSVLVTAHDIIFFWVARMIVMGLKFMNDVPFRDVFITPLIMAEGGGKMSKSKGNAIDPLELTEKHGADSVRMTLATHAAQARTVQLSMKRFEGYRDFTNKLWNAARFVLMNVEDLDAATLAAGPLDAEPAIEDRWILSRLGRAAAQADRALEEYRFDEYMQALYDFTWKEYCAWHLELVKPRLYAKAGDAEAVESRRRAQVVLATVLETLMRLLHPVAPFITEEIWRRLKEQWEEAAAGAANPSVRALEAESLTIAPWPTIQALRRDDDEAEARMGLLQETVHRARRLRAEMGVRPNEATELEIATADRARREQLERCRGFFHALIELNDLRIVEAPTEMPLASTAIFEDVTVRLPLPPELRQRERARLEKEIGRLEGEAGRIEAKLANADFTDRAPEDVVRRARTQLATARTDLKALQAKQKALG